MTERKPPGMDVTSWIDRQVAEAEKRGVFDNLPGTGKPLPAGGDADHGQTWLRNYLRREGVPADDLLPAPLKLRKEIERLTAEVPDLDSEQQVRETVREINRRIMDWRRIATGPPIFVPVVNEEAMVARWHAAQPEKQPGSSPADAGRAPGQTEPSRRRRWRGRGWRRRR